MSQQQGKQGVNPDQIFQNFTKQSANLQNTMLLLHETLINEHNRAVDLQKQLDEIKGKALKNNSTEKVNPVKAIIHTKKKKK